MPTLRIANRYRFSNFTKAQPLFRCLARLGRGKVIPVSVLSDAGVRVRCGRAMQPPVPDADLFGLRRCGSPGATSRLADRLMAPRPGHVTVRREQIEEAIAAREEAERPRRIERRCVHCFRRTPALPGVRVVCEKCRDLEAALNGGSVRPAVQPALVARPPGEQPWWTPQEDRALASCRTAAEPAARLPWRSKVSCNYRFKVLRRRGRLRPFDHRVWQPEEDARVAAVTSPAEIRTLARELDRTVVAVHRRRGELRQRDVRVTRLRPTREAA